MTPGARLTVTYHDGTSSVVVAAIGDMTRMSMKFGPKWATEAEADPLPHATYLAWLASRHADPPQTRDYEQFLDDLAAIEVAPPAVDALRPTDAVRGNGSPSSSPSPPAPTPDAGSTPTPVSP